MTAYSFYRSDRHPATRRTTAKTRPKRHYRHLAMSVLVIAMAGLLLLGISKAYEAYQQNSSSPQALAVAEGPKQCAPNNQDKLIVVSVSERHLWACQRHKVVYNTAIITGMEFLPADLTPRGTYQVYAKQTDTTLTGSDSTGNWSDPVKYWMPFLDNQYGTYGFHDATWRSNNEFGNVDPNSKNASHGCVELPLGASKWLYEWSSVGTTVVVKN